MIARTLVKLTAVSVVATGALLCPTDVGVRAASAADACALVTNDEAIAVIGSSVEDLAGPLVVRPGTCSWHSTQSGCTMRSLSVLVSTGSAARRLEDLRAQSTVWAAAPEVGDDAFFTADELPTGSAVFIEHLHLRRGDTLAEVTLVGRIGPDASHDLLGRVGAAVMARL